MNATTKAIRGIGVEIRAGGYCWKAVVKHLGGGGTDYFRFNGGWRPWFQSDIPAPIYRQLRKGVRAAVATALGR